MVGIYLIKNRVNNKVYVGSSNNIARRFRKHRTELNNGVHCNKHLEKAYKKYGKDSFDFIILEICLVEELLEKEIFYINKYDSLNSDKGYNLCNPVKNSNLNCSEEYRKKLSNSKKGKKPKNYENMREKRWKKVEVSDEEGNIQIFNSLKEAESKLGIKRGNVYNYLKGKTKCIKSHSNLKFKYV